MPVHCFFRFFSRVKIEHICHFTFNWISKNIEGLQKKCPANIACKRRFCLRSSVCALCLQKELRLVRKITGFVEVGLLICWCKLYNFFAILGLFGHRALGPSSQPWLQPQKLGPQTVSSSSSACRCSSTNCCQHKLKQHVSFLGSFARSEKLQWLTPCHSRVAGPLKAWQLLPQFHGQAQLRALGF